MTEPCATVQSSVSVARKYKIKFTNTLTRVVLEDVFVARYVLETTFNEKEDS